MQDAHQTDRATTRTDEGTSHRSGIDEGTDRNPVDITYFDSEWRWDNQFYYKLSAVDAHENESGFALVGPGEVTGVGDGPAPAADFLGQNRPNPFNPTTTIRYGLSQPGHVSLRVYDATGRLVRTLVDATRPAGSVTPGLTLVNPLVARYPCGMIGSLVSHYRIVEKLGQGGMGEVFLADDTTLDRKVALKFLPPHVAQDEEMLARFEREAKATAALQHPNIVTIHEIGSHEGRRFIVMAYIEGDLLSTRIKRGDLSIQAVIEIAAALANAVSEAHRAQIIHRDLKPDNIIIDKRGEPHVLDFGLAVQGGATRLTHEGSTVGTLHYMSPEQTRGEAVDERTDIFSLGAIMYEMVTCQKAFPGDNSAAIINNILNAEPQAMARFNSEVSEDFERIVTTALAKDTEVRYQTMSGLVAAIKPLLGSGSTSAIASGVASTTQHGASPNRSRAIFAVVAAVIVIAGAWLGYKALAPSGSTEDTASTTPAAATQNATGQIRTLAVLPLQDNSQGGEDSYFADAMTVALIHELSRVSALTVFPTSSVLRFKGSEEPIDVIAEQLGADAVITGSVWQDGDRIRLNVDLVPADASERLWGDSYESEVAGMLALQARLAREITGQVQVSLAPLEEQWLASERAVDPEALKAYMKGLYNMNLMTRDGYVKADELFKRAVALDPNFARAHYAVAMISSYSSPPDVVEAKVMKALELDPNLADALALLASIQLHDKWDIESAQKTIDRAKALQPNNPRVRQMQGDLLLVAGKRQAGIDEYVTAVALNPLSHPIACSLVSKYKTVEFFERAVDYGIEVSENFPDCAFEHFNVGESYMHMRQYDQALRYLQRSYDMFENPGTLAMIGCVYARSGERDRAEEILAELTEMKITGVPLAQIHVSLGNHDEALNILEAAYEERSGGLMFLDYEPTFNEIRDDPRFIELVNKVKQPAG